MKIPLVSAKAGTQLLPLARYWIPACAGMSGWQIIPFRSAARRPSTPKSHPQDASNRHSLALVPRAKRSPSGGRSGREKPPRIPPAHAWRLIGHHQTPGRFPGRFLGEGGTRKGQLASAAQKIKGGIGAFAHWYAASSAFGSDIAQSCSN